MHFRVSIDSPWQEKFCRLISTTDVFREDRNNDNVAIVATAAHSSAYFNIHLRRADINCGNIAFFEVVRLAKERKYPVCTDKKEPSLIGYGKGIDAAHPLFSNTRPHTHLIS